MAPLRNHEAHNRSYFWKVRRLPRRS